MFFFARTQWKLQRLKGIAAERHNKYFDLYFQNSTDTGSLLCHIASVFQGVRGQGIDAHKPATAAGNLRDDHVSRFVRLQQEPFALEDAKTVAFARVVVDHHVHDLKGKQALVLGGERFAHGEVGLLAAFFCKGKFRVNTSSLLAAIRSARPRTESSPHSITTNPISFRDRVARTSCSEFVPFTSTKAFGRPTKLACFFDRQLPASFSQTELKFKMLY